MKRTLVSLVIGLSLLMGAMNGADAQYYDPSAWNFDRGVRAYESRDFATALKEWTASAELGNAIAKNNLGAMYAKGEGVVQDYKKAARWYRLSALNLDKHGQYNLSLLLAEGQGIAQDYKEALRLMRMSAAQGLADAQAALGVFYAKGHGVIQDNVLAHMWFNIGGSNGSAKGSKDRDSIAASMTTAQIAEAQKLARECVAKNYKGC